jgi:hypothetical protein
VLLQSKMRPWHCVVIEQLAQPGESRSGCSAEADLGAVAVSSERGGSVCVGKGGVCLS